MKDAERFEYLVKYFLLSQLHFKELRATALMYNFEKKLPSMFLTFVVENVALIKIQIYEYVGMLNLV